MNIENINADWMDFSQEVPTARVNHITRKFMDIPYGTHGKQLLDIYLPEEGDGPFPVIVNVHGGGFTHCDKGDFHLYPTFYALEQGFAVVAVNYRLSPEVKFPQHIYDIKNAIRWISSNASLYMLDAHNLFLWGTSAGGYIVSMVGVICATYEIDENSQKKQVSSKKGVAVLCPLIDLRAIHEQLGDSQLYETTKKILDVITGSFFGTDNPSKELLHRSNPENYITSKIPPFYIQHGSLDPLVPLEQARHFYSALCRELGHNEIVLDILENATHAGDGDDFFLEKNISPITNFFKEHIRREDI